MRFKAGQRAVKQASHATVASMGSFGSDVIDATRMLARDAPTVARRVQQDLGNAALDVHHYVRDAGVTAGKGLCHATQQVGFTCSFLMQCKTLNPKYLLALCWCRCSKCPLCHEICVVLCPSVALGPRGHGWGCCAATQCKNPVNTIL